MYLKVFKQLEAGDALTVDALEYQIVRVQDTRHKGA